MVTLTAILLRDSLPCWSWGSKQPHWEGPCGKEQRVASGHQPARNRLLTWQPRGWSKQFSNFGYTIVRGAYQKSGPTWRGCFSATLVEAGPRLWINFHKMVILMLHFAKQWILIPVHFPAWSPHLSPLLHSHWHQQCLLYLSSSPTCTNEIFYLPFPSASNLSFLSSICHSTPRMILLKLNEIALLPLPQKPPNNTKMNKVIWSNPHTQNYKLLKQPTIEEWSDKI